MTVARVLIAGGAEEGEAGAAEGVEVEGTAAEEGGEGTRG